VLTALPELDLKVKLSHKVEIARLLANGFFGLPVVGYCHVIATHQKRFT
jgi:hypothetical protein